ncbi:MAG: glycosyltransferase family 2 protein [Kiritimatiellae bacterium]|nr:glycosyltransferase family 2 protein [Kiritimatiellia bacterium]
MNEDSNNTGSSIVDARGPDHTFAVCAYGDSPYLEECLRSLKGQTRPSRIFLATHTPSPFLEKTARHYGIELLVNEGPGGITQDWNFALAAVKTRFATVAHQDDTYEPEYAERVLDAMRAAPRPLIAFSDYGELRGGERVLRNRLLNIKRLMLLPLRPQVLASACWTRRLSLAFGDAICCPSVTFCLDNVPRPVFRDGFRSCEDWEAWERISRLDGQFLYIKKPLLMHRIHPDSETSKIIGDGARKAENLSMFLKFWPRPIAFFLNHFYNASERSNAFNTHNQGK